MIRARKTHCKRGHEFTSENTYERKGTRWCRRCMYDRSHAWDKQARKKYPERYREYERRDNNKLKAAGLCLFCRTAPATTRIVGGNRGKKINSCATCRTRFNVERAKDRLTLKIEVLSHYGPNRRFCCSWIECEVNDPDMLTIDHIDNSGAEDRRGITAKGGITFYARLKRLGYPDGFQTLCHNHQWKKEIVRRREVAKLENVLELQSETQTVFDLSSPSEAPFGSTATSLN